MRVTQEQFRAAVRYFVYRGVRPTPTRLNLALGREHLAESTEYINSYGNKQCKIPSRYGKQTLREINGRECQMRADVLTQHGWHLCDWVRGQQPSRWTPPADWQEIGDPQVVVNEIRAFMLNLAPYPGKVR